VPEQDIARLGERFGDRLIFCGSVCVQTTLAWGSPEDVRREVRRRLALFPRGGLFLGPTHAVQVGSPLENILAMYGEAGSLCDPVDPAIYAIEDPKQPDKINMSKLF
jgi:uroporphyrinogen decarboxylase